MTAAIEQETILRMLADADSLIRGVAGVISQMESLDTKVQQSNKGLNAFGVALGNILGKIGLDILQAPIKAFKGLERQIKRLYQPLKRFTMMAAQVEVQWRTLSLAAGNAGKSFQEVEGYVKALRAAGIKTSEALTSVTQFLATGLPVDNIKELARRAQDMAVVIGRDSTEAFSRFSWFLQTGNSMLLKTMGIQKTATQMMKDYAKSINKTVKALTDRERKEALVQGLMKATIGYEGAYEEALKDPYKRWTSIPRLISNASEVLGAVFVPMMGTVVDIVSDALEKFESLFRVTKKGAYSMMAAELGKAVEDLTGEEKATAIDKFFGQWKEGFFKLRALVSVFADWLKSLWEGLIGDSEDWGESMMDNIVNGLITGINAIAQVMAKATGMIADFLAPGSPPKKGPLSTMDQWGAELMRDYMSGWTKVDFSALQQVAGTVQAVIQSAFTAAGGGDKLGLAERLLAGRRAAAEAVSKGGAEVGGLREMAGPLFQDLAKYLNLVRQYKVATQGVEEARSRLAQAEDWVAQASNKVASAQERVAKTQEWVEEASKKVEAVRRRVQKIEAQWAEIPERFTRGRKRQLQAEIEAAEEEERRRRDALEQQQEIVEAAKEEEERRKSAIDIAKEGVQIAQGRAKAVQEAMGLQQQILQELQKQMGMEAKIAAERLKAQQQQEIAIEKMETDFETLDEQMQKYKDEIKERLQPAFDNLTTSFSNLKDIGGGVWEILKNLPSMAVEWWEKLQPVRDFFSWLWEAIQKIVEMWDKLQGGLDILKDPLLSFSLKEKGLIPALLGKGEEDGEAPASRVPLSLEMAGAASEKFLEWLGILKEKEQETAEIADAALAQPFIDAAERASREVVGASILPDMVEATLGWFTKLSEDVVLPMTAFRDNTVIPFDEVTLRWRANLDLLYERFTSLIGRLEILSLAIQGLPPLPEDLMEFIGGDFKVVTVNLQGSTFGAGISKGDVDEWMNEALAGVIE